MVQRDVEIPCSGGTTRTARPTCTTCCCSLLHFSLTTGVTSSLGDSKNYFHFNTRHRSLLGHTETDYTYANSALAAAVVSAAAAVLASHSAGMAPNPPLAANSAPARMPREHWSPPARMSDRTASA